MTLVRQAPEKDCAFSERDFEKPTIAEDAAKVAKNEAGVVAE